MAYFHASLYLLVQVGEGNETSKWENLHIQDYVLVATLPALFLSSGFALFTQAGMFVTAEAAVSTLIVQETTTKTLTAVLYFKKRA